MGIISIFFGKPTFQVRQTLNFRSMPCERVKATGTTPGG